MAPDSVSRAEEPWHSLTPAQAFEALASTPAGLDDAEAARRIADVGPNELAFARITPWWRVLLRQFTSPLIAILLVAAAVTAIQQHWVDSGAIVIVLVINATLGFVQERKAEADVRALQSLSTPSCRVLRDGAARIIPGRDVVLLETGERGPADLRLFRVNGLLVNESLLTGESAAIPKHTDPLQREIVDADKTNLAFSGTHVESGRGRGIVIATGARTALGEINALIQGASGQTPLQVLTHRLERRIGLIVLGALVIIFIAGLVLGNDVSTMFRTSVGLAVASIPESLPIVLTVALSVGVSRMVKRNAIIRTLPAVETLGSTDVIGSDKTGTLTENRLTVERIWTTAGAVDATSGDVVDGTAAALVRAVLRAGALTNEATVSSEDGEEYSGDAVDAAMARVAVACGAITDRERAATPTAHQPYEPHIRYSQTVHTDASGRRTLYVKGSPEALIEASVTIARLGGEAPLIEAEIHAANEELGRDGLRVIATGSRVLDDDERLIAPLPPPSGLVFLGMEGMTDPPREGVAAAIRQCQEAGITVMMITGDHPVTAMAIADRLGLGGGTPVTGAEMAELDDHILAARLEETNVAARVSPHDKLRIVRVLQDRGRTVAVTGDGVNDAPALKEAAIGVAMGRGGTDVAREASDVVLTDDNFVTIVHAVEEGRVTFAAIRKTTYFLLSTGAAALVAVSLSVFAGTPLLFLPVQMVWMNLVTNGAQDIALALEPAEGDELSRSPRPRSEGVLSRTLWFRAGITGVWMAVGVLLTFIVELRLGYAEEHARTMALTMFVMFSFFQVFSSRAEVKSLFQLRPLANIPLILTSLGALLLHWAAQNWSPSADLLGMTRLSASEWLVCAAVGSTVLVIVEAEKAVRRWSHRNDGDAPSRLARSLDQ